MVNGSHANLLLHLPPRLLDDAQWDMQLLYLYLPPDLSTFYLSRHRYINLKAAIKIPSRLRFFPSLLHLCQRLPVVSVLFILFELGRDCFQ